MAANYHKIKKGINLEPQTGSTVNAEGDVAYRDDIKKLEIHDGSTADNVVQETKAATLTNKTLTAPVISSIVNVGTLTLPTSTDTLVGKATTDTLTNKSIDATTNTLTNIANSSISATAAIARSKLASGTAYRLLANDVSGVMSENAALTAANVIYADANGQLAGEAHLAKSRGGSGQDNSSLTFPSSGTLGTLAGAETLTNKTFGDAPIFTQIATPSTPASGFNKIYPKSDGNFYTLNSSGIEQPVGSGAGGGSKNYLGTVNNVNGNGNFELGSTSGWSLFNTTVSGSFPTGSITAGATSLTQFGVVSSGQLAGTYSLSVGTASGTAWASGQGFISNAFTIDAEDAAKVLTIKAYYKAVAGASNLNWSGTTANNLALVIYDVTNSAWIQPSGTFGFTQSSGVGYLTGTFQTSSNGTQYRVAILNVNGSAAGSTGATTIYFDDISVGPQTAPLGAVVTDWQSYTPTFSAAWGTVTNSTFWYKRIGDSIRVQGTFESGTTTSGTIRVSIPSGLSIDTNKINTTQGSIVGTSTVSFSATNGSYNGLLLFVAPGQTSNISFTNMANGSVTKNLTELDNSYVSSSTYFSLEFTVPIAGWSSTVQMSNDTDTRIVAMRVGGITPTASISTTPSLVTFGSGVAFDTHSAFNTSTGLYTVPISGYYRATFSIDIGGTYSVSSATAYIAQNGTVVQGCSQQTSSNAQFQYPVCTVLLKCNAGDTIAPYVATNASSPSIGGSTAVNFFQVERLSGPSTIAATETVAASYTGTPPQTPAQATFTGISYPTKNFDTHNAYNTSTGLYTCPVSGIYEVSVNAIVISTMSAGQPIDTGLNHNGTLVQSSGFLVSGSASAFQTQTGTFMAQCNAGDTLQAAIYIGGTSNSFNTANTYNYINIKRLGN